MIDDMRLLFACNSHMKPYQEQQIRKEFEFFMKNLERHFTEYLKQRGYKEDYRKILIVPAGRE